MAKSSISTLVSLHPVGGKERSFFLPGGGEDRRNGIPSLGVLTESIRVEPSGENQLIEPHNRYMEWREIASQAGVDPVASV